MAFKVLDDKNVFHLLVHLRQAEVILKTWNVTRRSDSIVMVRRSPRGKMPMPIIWEEIYGILSQFLNDLFSFAFFAIAGFDLHEKTPKMLTDYHYCIWRRSKKFHFLMNMSA